MFLTFAFLYLIKTVTPAKWYGNYTVTTYTAGNSGWGFIVASLWGIHTSEDGIHRGFGSYLILMAGFSVGEFFNASWTRIGPVYTPGIFKAYPTTLIGPVIFLSASYGWPFWAKSVGGGATSTAVTIGMGFTPQAPIGWYIGKDRGIDLMAGISFPMYLNPIW